MQFNVASLLLRASELLSAVSDSPRLDAELMLANVMQVSRSYLYAYPEKNINEQVQTQFEKMLQRRLQGEPVAYIVGYQEFWSLLFKVTPHTLIPRPETEGIIEFVLQYVTSEKAIIADLGTGSGAIAIALAYERPAWQIHATDQSEEALLVAKENANTYHLPIHFHLGHWCEVLPPIQFDAIVSNPPYIAEHDFAFSEKTLAFEPKSALVSNEMGFSALKMIIETAYPHLQRGGWLVLEHGFDQAALVQEMMKKRGYSSVSTYRDYAGIERITVGKI
ncbi:MAG: peptide chain release factor N(5)-glutamine methyltransferase [Firmicutes bacterium]|nr:peptide chain release factor N(5)-glutamine methyltransferase [Bacillota bacterium]